MAPNPGGRGGAGRGAGGAGGNQYIKKFLSFYKRKNSLCVALYFILPSQVMKI